MSTLTLEQIALQEAEKWRRLWESDQIYSVPFVRESIRGGMTALVEQAVVDRLRQDFAGSVQALAERLVQEWLAEDHILPPPSREIAEAIEGILYDVASRPEALLGAAAQKKATVYRIVKAGGAEREVAAAMKVSRAKAKALIDAAQAFAGNLEIMHREFFGDQP